MDRLRVFNQHMSKTPEERDSVIQTGLYNSYIAGYLAITLEEMGHSPEEIRRAVRVLANMLDLHTTQEARERQETNERGL